MNKLLLDDKPLIILPSLAEKVGLNESIVLQQLHYWLMDSKHFHDDHKWIYNTYSDWKKQFPFWSDKTIRRTITKLENEGLIISGNYNKLPIDKTKWYRINYEQLEIVTSPCGQNDQSMWSNCPVEEVNLTRPLPEITTENTTDIENIYIAEKQEENEEVLEIYNYWVSKNIINHRTLTKKMKSHINARLKEFTFEEIIKAIENYSIVLDDPKYYWTHRWTLEDFMKPNNIIRFTDDSNPLQVFLNHQKQAAGKSSYKTAQQALREAEKARLAWGGHSYDPTVDRF